MDDFAQKQQEEDKLFRAIHCRIAKVGAKAAELRKEFDDAKHSSSSPSIEVGATSNKASASQHSHKR